MALNNLFMVQKIYFIDNITRIGKNTIIFCKKKKKGVFVVKFFEETEKSCLKEAAFRNL